MRTISITRARWLMILGLLTFFLSLYWDRWLTGIFAFASLGLVFMLLLRFVSVGTPVPDEAVTPPDSAPAPVPDGAAASSDTATSSIKRSVRLSCRLTLEMLVLGVAMLLHWWVLSHVVEHPESFPSLMQESAAMQRLGAGVISLFIAMLIVLLCIVFSAFFVMHLDYWNLSDPPDNSPQGRQRRWLLGLERVFCIVLGLSMGTIILDRGKLYRPDGQEVDVKGCAGPIYLDVREGQVAVIETRGLTSDAVDGRHWLEANQRVTGMADLTMQTAHVVVEQATTRDGMIINRFEFSVRYQIGKGKKRDEKKPDQLAAEGENTDGQRQADENHAQWVSEDAPGYGPGLLKWVVSQISNRRAPSSPSRDDDGLPKSGQFPYQPNLTREKMWKDTPETYKSDVITVASHVARTVIGLYELQQIAILPDGARSIVEDEILGEIQRQMDKDINWLEIKSVAIGKIDLPDEARKELIDRWAADMQSATGVIRAEAQKAVMIVKSQGQAEAFRALEVVKTSVRADLIEQLRPLVGNNPQLAGRYLDAIESLAGYMAQDSVQALQVVETLEGMARSSKAFNLNITAGGLMQQVSVADGLATVTSAGSQPRPSGPPSPPGSQPPAPGSQPSPAGTATPPPGGQKP